MNICLIVVLYNLQKLSSWIIYKVHVHVSKAYCLTPVCPSL